jgi:glycosyltransferase involved in cell wall biosynthesis
MEVYSERMIRSLADRARFTIYAAGGRSDGAARVEALGAWRGLRTQPLSLVAKSWARVRRSGRDFDLVNAQTPLAGLVARRAKRLFGVPYVVTVHVFGADPAHAGGQLSAFAYSCVEQLVFSQAAAIIPTGRRLAAALEKRYQGIYSKITLVTAAGEGVKGTVPRDQTRARLEVGLEEEFLLFLGRLVVENGLNDLLAAFSLLRQNRPRLRLLIAGTGDCEMEVSTRIEREGWNDRVRMIGAVRGQEKLDLLAAADLMVRCSRHEVFPEAYLEALSVGTPVAATPAGDTAELAEESGAIELLPLGDPDGQARVLAKLLDDRARRAAMHERALAYSRRVRWETQKERYWNVLERAAGGRA